MEAKVSTVGDWTPVSLTQGRESGVTQLPVPYLTTAGCAVTPLAAVLRLTSEPPMHERAQGFPTLFHAGRTKRTWASLTWAVLARLCVRLVESGMFLDPTLFQAPGEFP
jgi:hypothetical protein